MVWLKINITIWLNFVFVQFIIDRQPIYIEIYNNTYLGYSYWHLKEATQFYINYMYTYILIHVSRMTKWV